MSIKNKLASSPSSPVKPILAILALPALTSSRCSHCSFPLSSSVQLSALLVDGDIEDINFVMNLVIQILLLLFGIVPMLSLGLRKVLKLP